MKASYLALAGAALLAACDQGPPPPEKTVQQLMADDVQPTAEIYWDSVGHVSELVDGEVVNRDFRPETDEEWQRVEGAATRLVELGELLKTPGYAEGRGADWIDFADGLIAASRQAQQAAAAKDPDKVFEDGGTVYSVCAACHQVYPPAEGLPEDGDAA